VTWVMTGVHAGGRADTETTRWGLRVCWYLMSRMQNQLFACITCCCAGIAQVVLILGSGLLLFVSRTPSEDSSGGYGGYTSF
jgi:hypothetical protein